MNIKLYQIDAFTDKVFGGNPAAVCPLNNWIPGEVMQNIAMENNLAETAFYVKQDDAYAIRWFTPSVEVDLCGHATLAAAHVLFNFEGFSGKEINFHSHRSGSLKVYREEGDLLTLDFPADSFEPAILPSPVMEAFPEKPLEVYKGKTDFMVVFKNETQVKNFKPDLQHILSFPDCRGVIITARGDTVDFVSRFFAPQSGIDEDPVTGSAHTTLTPYWAKQLQKASLTALQLSTRTGRLQCRNAGGRVYISGHARTYLKGTIEI